MKLIYRFLGISTDFQQLFFTNEFKTLAGDRKKVIGMLVVIFFLTFMALGFALGSIENLQSKMDNPFTNWVDLPITNEVVEAKSRIYEDFQLQENLDKFKLDNIAGSKRFYLEIFKIPFDLKSSPQNRPDQGAWFYTLAEDDKLVSQIFEKQENILWVNKTDETETLTYSGCNVIISGKIAEDLGFDLGQSELGNLIVNDKSGPIRLKIAAVVSDLPKSCDFICTPQLYNILDARTYAQVDCDNVLNKNGNGTSAMSFLVAESDDLELITEEVFRYFDETPGTHRMVESFFVGSTKYQVIEYYLNSSNRTYEEIENCVTHLRSKDLYLSQFTHFKSSEDWCPELNEYYNLAFNFKNLDEIRNFKNHMKDEYSVEIDMSQIEAKENFNLVTKLTTLISLILLVFAILSIMLFVQNLLSSHLFKIRSKLGTFKAFGMSNNELNIVYLKIIFSFLALGIVIAFMSVAAYDLLESTISEESKFNIFDFKTLLTIVAILLISLLMSYNTIKKILGDTPGNLIYER